MADSAAMEEKRAAEKEKEDRRLSAAGHKTQLRVQRRLLLSAFLGLDDWAHTQAQASTGVIVP